jgi:Glycosyl transferase family 2
MSEGPAGAAGAPSLSVIIPAHDLNGTLDRCLRGVASQVSAGDEVVLVVDGPERDLPSSMQSRPAAVQWTGHRTGPARARNVGATVTSGDVLVFVDSDVELEAGALAIVRGRFERESGLDAVFGSYDDDPAAPGIVSQYKNLLHHFVHARSAGAAVTFWTGCGAIRRRAFDRVGGFDESYRRPSVEDIDLGMRLFETGGRVELDPLIRGKHLKRWTLAALVVSDVRDRAIPWSRLLVDRWWFPATLNLDRRSRISATFMIGALALAAATPWWTPAAALALAALGAAVACQLDFYRFLAGRRGIGLALASIPVHLCYHVYSAASFVAVILSTPWRRRRARAAASRT